MTKALLLGTLLLMFNSCSDKNPVTNSGNAWLAVSSTFESLGAQDLSGWEIHGQMADDQVQFSTEVPPNGGKWSIQLASNSRSTPYIEIRVPIDSTDKSSDYYFSFSVKGFGTASISIHSWNHILHPTVWTYQRGFKTDSWQEYTYTLSKRSAGFDSLSIILSPRVDSTAIALFDNIQVIAVKQ